MKPTNSQIIESFERDIKNRIDVSRYIEVQKYGANQAVAYNVFLKVNEEQLQIDFMDSDDPLTTEYIRHALQLMLGAIVAEECQRLWPTQVFKRLD